MENVTKKSFIVDRWGYSLGVLSHTFEDEDGHTVFVSEDGREYPGYNCYYLHDLNGQCEEQWNCEVAQGNGISYCQCGMCHLNPEDD